MSLNVRSVTGFSDETNGVAITAVPTTVTKPKKEDYRWEVDTTAGDIDFSALAITNAVSGQTFEFLKTSADSNGMLFTDPLSGVVYNFNLQGDILSIRTDGTIYRIAA